MQKILRIHYIYITLHLHHTTLHYEKEIKPTVTLTLNRMRILEHLLFFLKKNVYSFFKYSRICPTMQKKKKHREIEILKIYPQKRYFIRKTPPVFCFFFHTSFTLIWVFHFYLYTLNCYFLLLKNFCNICIANFFKNSNMTGCVKGLSG